MTHDERQQRQRIAELERLLEAAHITFEQLERQCQPLRWTDATPDRPGWWWYRDLDDHEIPDNDVICYVYRADCWRAMFIEGDGVDIVDVDNLNGQWSDRPVAMPEETP